VQCEELVQEGATAGKSPAAVVAQCPITFAMLAQDDVALEVSSELTRGQKDSAKIEKQCTYWQAWLLCYTGRRKSADLSRPVSSQCIALRCIERPSLKQRAMLRMIITEVGNAE
jgi:hypothetical protein